MQSKILTKPTLDSIPDLYQDAVRAFSVSDDALNKANDVRDRVTSLSENTMNNLTEKFDELERISNFNLNDARQNRKRISPEKYA